MESKIPDMALMQCRLYMEYMSIGIAQGYSSLVHFDLVVGNLCRCSQSPHNPSVATPALLINEGREDFSSGVVEGWQREKQA